MKKGVTLIELLIAMGVAAILITSELSVFSHLAKSRAKDSIEKRNNFYNHEALMFIEEQLSKAQSVSVLNNKIIITRIAQDRTSNAIYKDKIFLSNDDISIYYYRNDLYNAQNNILTKVSGFNVKLVNNVLYVKIKKNDQEIERCFFVRTVL